MKVGDLMSRDVLTVRGDQNIVQVTELMREKNASCALVTEDLTPLGIVTENDFVVRVLAANKDPKLTKVTEIMSSPVIHITPDVSILDAIVLMRERDFSQLPVVENERLTGVVRLTDLMRYLAGFFSAHRW